MVAEATGLTIHRFLSFAHGGGQQIGARIAYNEIDMVLCFDDPQQQDPRRGHHLHLPPVRPEQHPLCQQSGHRGDAGAGPGPGRSGLARRRQSQKQPLHRLTFPCQWAKIDADQYRDDGAGVALSPPEQRGAPPAASALPAHRAKTAPPAGMETSAARSPQQERQRAPLGGRNWVAPRSNRALVPMHGTGAFFHLPSPAAGAARYPQIPTIFHKGA